MPDLVSIIVPVYNAERWLVATLECIVHQTYPHVEAIVVDDGSQDDSLQIARRFEGPNVRVLQQPNCGACAARNRGLAAAQGDWIQFIDGDDLMAYDKVEAQMTRLRNAPPRTTALCRWERFYDDSGDASPPEIDVSFEDKAYYRDYEDPADWTLIGARGDGMFPPHAWLAPRSVVDDAGPWDESLKLNQDGEFFNRVALASERILFCHDARVYYRSGLPGSISQRRTADALASKYTSVQKIVEQILDAENTLRTRRSCSIALRAYAYEAYPTLRTEPNEAYRWAESLDANADYLPGGSTLYQHLHQWLGWKTSRCLRRWYYRFRYNRHF